MFSLKPFRVNWLFERNTSLVGKKELLSNKLLKYFNNCGVGTLFFQSSSIYVFWSSRSSIQWGSQSRYHKSKLWKLSEGWWHLTKGYKDCLWRHWACCCWRLLLSSQANQNLVLCSEPAPQKGLSLRPNMPEVRVQGAGAFSLTHIKNHPSPCSPLVWIPTGTWTPPSPGHLLPTYPRLAPFPEDWTAHHLAWSFLALTLPYLTHTHQAHTHTHNHHHDCLRHSDCLTWKLSPDSLSPGHKSI